MESRDEAIQTYKKLVAKNKESLASLSAYVHTSKELFPRTFSQGFQQMKEKYDLTLTASKASIDRNAQLQAQLQFKQERLRSLREKFYRHFEEMEGLQFQMKRATGQLKKELRNRQESSRIMQSNQKLKRDVEKLAKRKGKLQQEEAELAMKERVKKQTIAKIQQEIYESQRRFAEEEKAQALRIQKLQQQISRQQSTIRSLKVQERNATPPKRNKSFGLDQLRGKIARQMQSLQD